MRTLPTAWMLLIAAAVAVTLVASPSRADGPAEQSRTHDADARRAEELFRRALALQDRRKLDLACPMFAENQRLDPNGVTMLHLAECYQGIGKTGSAWHVLKEVARVADKIGKNALIDEVRRRRMALRPKLLVLTVRIPPEAKLLKNARVTCDGAELDVTKPTHYLVVDSGFHVVVSVHGCPPGLRDVVVASVRRGRTVQAVARDWRDERIEALEALVREQQATIARQQAIIEAQQCTIARLVARVAELEAQMRRSSRNSSRPPSTDPPGRRRRRLRSEPGNDAADSPVMRDIGARRCRPSR